MVAEAEQIINSPEILKLSLQLLRLATICKAHRVADNSEKEYVLSINLVDCFLPFKST